MDSKQIKSRVRWDEENLTENEKIKNELNPRKIDEPKTPYHSPSAELAIEDYQKELETELSKEGIELESEDVQRHVSNGCGVTFDHIITSNNTPTENEDQTSFNERRKDHYRMKEALKK